MSECTALVCVPKRPAAPGVSAPCRRIFERAADEALRRPRVWLEALEPRRMMSAVGGAAPFAGNGGGFLASDVEQAADGKVYAAGQLGGVMILPGASFQWGLERFNPDGTLDRSFGPDGTGTVAFDAGGVVGSSLGYVLPEPDGGCVVAIGGDRVVTLERFLANGSIDRSYNAGQPVTLHDVGNDLPSEWDDLNTFHPTVLADGSVSVVWVADNDTLVEARRTADGRADEVFAPQGVRETPFQAPDGNYVTMVDAVWRGADGSLTAYVDYQDLNQTARLVRLVVDAGGALAAESVPLATMADGPFSFWVSPAADGSAAVGGPAGQVWRLDATGAVTGDPAFVGEGEFPYAFPTTPLADGRVVVQSGLNANEFVMLRGDGSVDPTFNGGQPVALRDGGWPLTLADGSTIYVLPGAGNVQIVNPDGTVIDRVSPPPSPDMAEAPPPASADPGDGADGEATAGADIPPAWAIDDGAGAGGSQNGLFDPAAGATLFDPDGSSVLN